MNPGQRLVLGIKEPYLSNSTMDFLKRKSIGGVILFDNNGISADQLKSLINQIYDACSVLPFIAVDYEGGKVSRLGRFFQPLAQPSEYNGKLHKLRIDCRKVGNEFNDIGINLNLAPVADIAYSPLNEALKDRTYSYDPSKVADYCLSFYEGFSENDIICCFKHFPGLGSSVSDPHDEIAVSCLARERITGNDLLPFKAGISAGIKMIMTTHLRMTEIDREIGTFSKKTVSLVRDMGFEGIIISDDLSMGAVKNEGSLPGRVLRTLCCGHDMALICHDYIEHEKIADYLENNLPLLEKHGHQEAVKRITDVKKSQLRR